jgi:hypothetical protein
MVAISEKMKENGEKHGYLALHRVYTGVVSRGGVQEPWLGRSSSLSSGSF